MSDLHSSSRNINVSLVLLNIDSYKQEEQSSVFGWVQNKHISSDKKQPPGVFL